MLELRYCSSIVQTRCFPLLGDCAGLPCIELIDLVDSVSDGVSLVLAADCVAEPRLGQ